MKKILRFAQPRWAGVTLVLLFTIQLKAQLFTNNFNTTMSAITAGTSGSDANYISSTSGSATNSQFNYMGAATTGGNIDINTTVSGALFWNRPSAGGGIGITRNASFGSPTSLMVRFTYIPQSGTGSSTGTQILIGESFALNSTSTPASIYASLYIGTTTVSSVAGFKINSSITPSGGTAAARTGAGSYTGSQTILWVINKSGSTMTYKSPSGTFETVGNNLFDVWVGTTKEYDEGGMSSSGTVTNTPGIQSTSVAMNNLMIRLGSGTSSAAMDDILIDPIPAAPGTGTATSLAANGFTANWATVSGITGYRLDVATDAAFNSILPSYDNLAVTGTSQPVTGLNPNTTYYYRVRAESARTIATFTGGHSVNMSATTTRLNNIATTNGNWNNPATWSLSSVPTSATTNASIANGVTVTMDVAGSCNDLALGAGSMVVLGANNLTVTGAISGTSSSSYVVTDGAGALIQAVSAGVAKTFPIGASTSSYDPATITPTSAATFSAIVKATTAAGDFSGTIVDYNKCAPRQWNITPTTGTPGSTVLTLKSGAAFTTTAAVMGHFKSDNTWEALVATFDDATDTWTATTTSFSPFGGGEDGGFAAAILPVEFTKFSATPNSTTNLLSWSTASEKDNLQFNIERSADGQTFTTIGTVKGKNTAASYNFTDNTPLPISHYRLAQQDYNGAVTYSKVVTVARTGKAGSLKVYPSTANEVVNLETVTTEGATLQIFDAMGRIVWTKDLGADGLNTTQVPVTHFARGLYIVVFETKGARTIERFVKD